MKKHLDRVLAACLAAWVLAGGASRAQSSEAYRETFRPQFHFSPASHWMNDPNGLVYTQGQYHLFYQYNPFGPRWGHMSWGHAVSADLLHWKPLPLALPEEDGIMIFSGSAVIDRKNTTGFGGAGRPPMVAIYTGRRNTDHRQFVCLAYSNDRGRSWTKYAGNPVIDIGSTDFRDPKVFWYEPARQWIMVLALSAQRKVRFYGSPNLMDWRHLSDFGPAGATRGVWECPDLFPLSVDGDPARKKWVLEVDLGTGSVAGGSGGQYFVGEFDGRRFAPRDVRGGAGPRGQTEIGGQAHWVDYGRDFYAAVSWSNVPDHDGRRIWIGWMNNWEYAQEIPTAPWRSAQSIPRTLGLTKVPGGLRLIQRPVRELRELRTNPFSLSGIEVVEGKDPIAPAELAAKSFEMVAEVQPAGATEFGIVLRKGKDEKTVVGYDVARAVLFVDRTQSGRADFYRRFAGRHDGPLPARDGVVKLHVFVDWSSVEVFGNDGETVITDRIFPRSESQGIELYTRGGPVRLKHLDFWKLKSVW